MRSTTLVGTALTIAISSCSSAREATITLTTGEELDAFSRPPTPTLLVAESLDRDGNVTDVVRSPLPTSEISLGDKPRSGVGAFRVAATDAAGKVLLRGESQLVQFGALENASFEIFVQRTGEFARLPRAPSPLDVTHASLAVGRYILAASGTTTFLYDLVLLQPAASLPALPREAKSLATFGTAALLIDDTGATALDLATGHPSEVPAPTGGTFAEVAGGNAITANDGSVVIVGGTRSSGGATPRILLLSNRGEVQFGVLTTSRQGACATWVEGRGVFVYGGGVDAASAVAEIIAPGASLGTPVQLPADPVEGCGAAALDASHVLVVGGIRPGDTNTGSARVIDLACTVDCRPVAWSGSLPRVRAEAFALGAAAALVLGNDQVGNSHVYRFAPGGFTELALKVPRRNAHLVGIGSTGAAAVVGGAAAIEQYLE